MTPISFKRHRFPGALIVQAGALVFPLHPQHSRCRGDPLLGHQVRAIDRSELAPQPAVADRPLVSR